jgi:pheromone shutdown protein TraB
MLHSDAISHSILIAWLVQVLPTIAAGSFAAVIVGLNLAALRGKDN